jgi:hypothetical protein
MRSPRVGKPPIEQHIIGDYKPELSLNQFHQFYEADLAECRPEAEEMLLRRTGEVFLKCCDGDSETLKLKRKAERKQGSVFIDSVVETKPCHYVYSVCAQQACLVDQAELQDISSSDQSAVEEQHAEDETQSSISEEEDEEYEPPQQGPVEVEVKKETAERKQPSDQKSAEISPSEQLELKEKVREMFYHGYNAYLNHAYPQVIPPFFSPFLLLSDSLPPLPPSLV